MSRAENTLLPAPSDKEAVAVFLRFLICILCPGYRHIFRVKPRTSRERAIQKENWGEKRDEDEEVVRVETDHQVTLVVY